MTFDVGTILSLIVGAIASIIALYSKVSRADPEKKIAVLENCVEDLENQLDDVKEDCKIEKEYCHDTGHDVISLKQGINGRLNLIEFRLGMNKNPFPE